MIQYNKFYDFTSTYENSKYVVFGVPFDNTSTFRSGSRWAPDSMRKINNNFESYDYFHNLDMIDLPVYDGGNIPPSINIEDMMDEIYLEVTSIINDEKIPIMIGGEHSISYSSIKACSEYYKDTLYTIILDAHLDMKNEYGGMKYNHASVSRNIYDKIMKNIVMIGLRSGTKEEWDFLNNNKIIYYTSIDIQKCNINSIIDNISKIVKNNYIYLSIDMDILDPIYCSGIGTPEPFGIHPNDVKSIINFFSKKIIGMDIVEISPEYDKELSSIIATKFLKEYIYSKESHI